jgi:two-component system, cell cycle sensor histidine kinase and response regulator CckA
MPEPRTILVVDDEASVRMLLCQALRRCGFHPIEAGSGRDALAVADVYQGNIKALVSDVVMPGMNGTDLARQLCAARPSLKVVLISGYTDELPAMQPGWVFLQKPFLPDTLCDKLKALCGGEETEEKLRQDMQKSHKRYLQSSQEYDA